MSAEKGTSVPQAKSQIIRMDMDGEAILYDQMTQRTHVLTETAVFVFEQCDGKTSVEDIKTRLSARNANAADDVAEVALHRLAKSGLITGYNQKAWQNPTSRRDALKRIAMMGGAVMIPRVLSINSAKQFGPVRGVDQCNATTNVCPSGYICCNQGNAPQSTCQCELITETQDTCSKFGKSPCPR